jgi:hypothetical protein
MNAREAAPYWQLLILQVLGACSLISHPSRRLSWIASSSALLCAGGDWLAAETTRAGVCERVDEAAGGVVCATGWMNVLDG